MSVGPHREPPSLQQYQTHIFAPPVTGAPTKKNKTVPASQLVTLGPGGVIVSGGKWSFKNSCSTVSSIFT